MKTTALAVTIALLSFFAGSAWIYVSAEMFVRYFYESRMVALTHVFTLGWVSLMILGVLRQLAPIAFGLQLQRPGLFSVAVALWTPGLIAMVVGFATLHYRWAAVGTSFLFLAVLLVTGCLIFGFRGIRIEPPHRHLLAALIYFLTAASLGTWMALAKGFDVALFVPFHRILFAHIHLAGAGWAGMMILAVLSRLFPQPHLRKPLQAKLRFAMFNVGLVGLASGLLIGGAWYPYFGALLAISCIWYAVAFIPVLHEFRQASDRSTAFLIGSWSFLIVVAVIGLWLSLAPVAPTVFTLQLQFAYGFIYMFGWLSLMIFGMLYRIIPTHVSKFMAARGISPIPGLRGALIDPLLQTLVLSALVVGLVVASGGILIEHVGLFRAGWTIWLAGAAGFLAGVLRLFISVKRNLRAA